MQAISSKIWCEILGITTDARGMVSGLVILWHLDNLNVNNFRENHFFICADSQVCNSEARGNLTIVYGPRIISQKPTFVSLLEKEAQEIESHFWIVRGDFNLITSLEENKGARRSLEVPNISFKDMIHRRQFVDIETGNI